MKLECDICHKEFEVSEKEGKELLERKKQNPELKFACKFCFIYFLPIQYEHIDPETGYRWREG